MVDEIKRIIKDSEILKYASQCLERPAAVILTCVQGGRYEVATEEQGRPTRTRDSHGRRAHFVRGMRPRQPSPRRVTKHVILVLDCKDRLSGGRQRIGGSRRSAGILLSCTRLEGSGLLVNLSALQGMCKHVCLSRLCPSC